MDHLKELLEETLLQIKKIPERKVGGWKGSWCKVGSKRVGEAKQTQAKRTVTRNKPWFQNDGVNTIPQRVRAGEMRSP